MAKKVIFGGVPGMVASDIEKMKRYVLEEDPEIDFHFFGEQTLSKEELIGVARDAQVIISWDQEMDDEIYSKLHLIAYCAASIGYNAANPEAATHHGVFIANVPDYCTDEVALHTLSFILALYRRHYLMIDHVKAGHWDLEPMTGIKKLEHCTLGLLGFGRIPRTLAKKLSGFGLRILAYDPYIDEKSMKEVGVTKVGLSELLEKSDYLSLHTPLTKDTRHIINEKSIAQMKDGVYLINTARGALIDEAALYDALLSGKIQAAALDVLGDEPPTAMGQKLIALKNTFITAHSSYASMEASDRQIRATAKNVAQFLAGEIPPSTINKKD